MSRHTAAEQLRVARKLREFPAFVEPFRMGRLSYSKVRSISRVAAEATIATLIDWARQTSAANIDRIVAARRRASTQQEVQAQQAARFLTYRVAEDGSLVGSFRLPPEQGAVFVRAIEAAQAVLPQPDPQIEEITERAVPAVDGCVAVEREFQASRRPAKSRADALLALADAAWEHLKVQARSSGDGAGLPGLGASRFDLTVHVPAGTPPADSADDTAPDGYQIEGGRRLHPVTGRRVSCDCRYVVQTDDANGNPLHLGHKTRRIRGGWHVENLGRNVLAFYRADGLPVPKSDAWPRSKPELAPDPRIAADAITGHWDNGPLPLHNCIFALGSLELAAAN